MLVTSALPPPLLWLLGPDAALAARLQDAAQSCAPGATVRHVAALAAAAPPAHGTPEILVLATPTDDLVAEALRAKDGAGLPRWGVVVCGERPANAEVPASQVLSPAEAAETRVLARVLLGTLDRLKLERDYARCRGDLTTFGFRVAHDLRTPLGGMLTTAEMLREILNEESPDKAALAQPILDSADGMVKLIERMSFIAKMAAGREQGQRFNMMLPFWNASQANEAAMVRAGGTLDQPRDWPDARGNPAWVEMIWRNLIANSLQHGGPAVKMTAGWERTPEGVKYFLRDNGQVAPEKRAMLFHPFERLHEPGAPRGFGLPTVRRLVELHGGRCGFEQPASGGSVFYFVLPAEGN